MKKLAVVMIAVGTLLSGCVVYPAGGHATYGYHDRDGVSNRSDRDRDGVPNRYDRRPNDPRRY